MRYIARSLMALAAAIMLIIGIAPSALAETTHYPIIGLPNVQSANNGVVWYTKAGQCNYQSKFTIAAGGVGTGGGSTSDLWIYGKLMSGYPRAANGKPNCRVNVSAQLYDWTRNTFDHIDVIMEPYPDPYSESVTHTDKFDLFTARKLGDYIRYSGLTLMGLEVNVEDPQLRKTYTGKWYDTRMCLGGPRERWDCGYWIKRTLP
ncbi:hypothetical protein [Nonomuraea jiangxiensis]|uniref:Uncharacterized protein n=1 Tax=Nonomuraea jiangxiensis TaxID=633440 RepID=A0A1G8HMH0_9ACTN|nr:hypothetical protein [Nonomuraea jiangxiensis]SDI07837.1 hypothetical protein SAMN05421869_104223 [Nonomuraea jiangxiensis]